MTSDSNGFAKLIEIGIALSAEHDHQRLMERILIEAKGLTNADGGTLYLAGNMVERMGVTNFEAEADGRFLKFEIMRTDSLDIAMGGTTGKDIPFPPLGLDDPESGEENHHIVAAHSALSGVSVNISDAYDNDEFDFAGPKKFDESTGYHSQSFLCVPLKNHQGEVIGVLQLINAQDPANGKRIPFSETTQPLVEALASQAAVALDNQMLLEAQKRLMDAFIKVIGGAIDAKSPYTGGHCARVPELSKMLGQAACDATDGPYKDFNLNDDEWRELHLAGWLHDCGKVVTPEYVVDKATKLETIYDRIHEVRMRFEVAKRDAEIAFYKQLSQGGDEATLKAEFDAKVAKLDDDFAFVAECNQGGEFMAPELVERLEEISKVTWQRTLDDRRGVSYEELKRMELEPAKPLPSTENLIADKAEHIFPRDGTYSLPEEQDFGFKMDVPELLYNRGELYNLAISRGTLTAEDRFIINNHVVQTIVMLEQLPFPKQLRRVPEYAGNHHETLIGTGYPRKLDATDMSTQARIMALADVFEALTAADRPYKLPKTLSASIKILSFMVKDQHIDADLFKLFLKSGMYKDYADKYLRPEQIDEVDIDQYM